MALPSSSNDPLKYLNGLRKPETAQQTQYRGVNANSTGGPRGGVTDPSVMPRVTGSVSMKPRGFNDYMAQTNPTMSRIDSKQQKAGPASYNTSFPKGVAWYNGPSQNDLQRAEQVNSMGQDQLYSLLDPNIKAWQSQDGVMTARYKSAPIAVSPGAPVPMINPQNHSAFYQYGAGGDRPLIPSPAVKSSPAIEAAQRVDEWNQTYDDIRLGNRMFDAMYPNSPGALAQSLSQTPRQNPGFSMNGPQQRSAFVPMRPREDVPSWSLNGGISPETQQAGQAFNQAVQPPAPVNTGKIISDRITENMNNASIQGRQDANDIVDRNLNARMGYYSTPQARRSGFFQRGMGPMAGDAAIMQRQNQPLGDGGPAAYAARADQDKRRRQAEEAMGGVGPDGLTRYKPNDDVLAFANQDRAREDQRISGLMGGGTQMRPAMEAMTPSEIQYYRHKMNMLTNPAYAERVNTERADRREMLDNRRNMVRARREGALEAAGASQQLRNLMAGRGAVAGQDGFNALMSAAAMQNPNQAFDSFGQAAMANNAPGMLRDRLRAEENMLGTRANIDRMQQYENMRMQIITSGMPQMEQQRALQSLNNSILMGGGFGAVQGPGAQGGAGAYVPPSGVPLPDAFPSDPSVPTVQRMATYMQELRANPQFQALPPEQQQQFIDNVTSQYFGGVRRSDREQYVQDNTRNPLTNLWNFGLSMFGLDPASQTRRQEAIDAINPYRAGSVPYREGQHVLTPEEQQAVEQMPDSRDRQTYERLLRQGIRQNEPRLGMWDAYSQLLGLGQ